VSLSGGPHQGEKGQRRLESEHWYGGGDSFSRYWRKVRKGGGGGGFKSVSIFTNERGRQGAVRFHIRDVILGLGA